MTLREGLWTILVALSVTGCTDKAEPADTGALDSGDADTDTGTASTPDQDEDGEPSIADGGSDCDDDDATVHPGAKESCDQIDSDCDGDLVDGFPDLDRDGMPDCADDDACAPAPHGLLIWLKGDDSTDHMDVATLVGTADHSPGVVGGAIDLTTQTGLRDLSPNPWLVSPLSIEAWIQTTMTGGSQTILAHYECADECNTSGPSPSAYFLRVNEAGAVEWIVRDADTPVGTDGDVVTGRTLVADGRWHHVVAVLEPSSRSMSIYVNGELDHAPYSMVDNDGSGFAQDTLSDTDPITVGYNRAATTGSASNRYGGLVDELSVYAAVLSEADARALHGAGIAGKCD